MQTNQTSQTNQQIIDLLKNVLTDQLSNIVKTVALIESINLTDEQFFIEYENWLNKISVIDHTIGIKGSLPDNINLDGNILI